MFCERHRASATPTTTTRRVSPLRIKTRSPPNPPTTAPSLLREVGLIEPAHAQMAKTADDVRHRAPTLIKSLRDDAGLARPMASCSRRCRARRNVNPPQTTDTTDDADNSKRRAPSRSALASRSQAAARPMIGRRAAASAHRRHPPRLRRPPPATTRPRTRPTTMPGWGRSGTTDAGRRDPRRSRPARPR